MFSCLVDTTSVLFSSFLCGSCSAALVFSVPILSGRSQISTQPGEPSARLSLSLSLCLVFSWWFKSPPLDNVRVCVCASLTLNSCQFQTFIFLSSHSLCPHFLHLLVQVSLDCCGKNVYLSVYNKEKSAIRLIYESDCYNKSVW